MGEYLDKWLPEMKAEARSTARPVPPEYELSTDQNGRKYKPVDRTCPDCGQDYQARIYYFEGGWTWRTDRAGYCPNCREKRADAIEEAEKVKLKAETDNQRDLWRRSCGIPRQYQFKGFQHFEHSWQPTAYNRCLEYAQNFPIGHPHGYESLILFSEKSWGTGKTHLACSIAHHILSRWNGETKICPVRFISEPVLFKDIRDTYSFTLQEKERLPSEKNIIDSLIQVPLLILDDLGKEEVSDLKFVQRTLFAIFDGRYNAELPVVVTANLNDAGLRAHMGGNAGNEASFNRLYEMCQGKFICVEGKSYREKLAGGKK